MRHLVGIGLAVTGLVLTLASRDATAFPQYQLAIDQTCIACHVSPAGGGLLNENGLAVAESTSAREGNAEFLNKAVELPAWLSLGGGVRLAAGLVGNRDLEPAAYPMQAELYGAAGKAGFSINVTGGLRRPQEDGSVAHVVWSREHYVMWRQHPDAPGMFVRVGRFMPVFGLRLAEHAVYTQRYGGLPLYGETYGAAVEYVGPEFEVHATGFVHDPIASAVEHGDGGALYGELRIGSHAAVGLEGKISHDDDQTRSIAGATGKLYLPDRDLLFQLEVELGHQKIEAGGTTNQVIAYLLATYPLQVGWLLDVGVGHYTEDTHVSGLYRDCLDANLHWFTTPHLELLATTRLELLDHGDGPVGGYALLQLHYRL